MLHIQHIVFCINQYFLGLFLARIDDGVDEDDWHFHDYTTKRDLPLRADRWFQQSEEALSSGDFAGIRINIWNRAKIRRFLTHSLSGGGSHNLGYHAMRWETITHGNAGEFGKYAVLKTLPDKIARFLYEFHNEDYLSHNLPPLPIDRSEIDVHGILKSFEVCVILCIIRICGIC